MPNNTRTRPDAGWVDGSVLLPGDWNDFERKIFWSWNGDRGGSYGPSRLRGGGALSFGGAGLQVTGPTRLTYGGAIRGGAGAFVIRDGTWPELGPTHKGRTRSIVCPIHTWTLPISIRNALTVDRIPPKTWLWSTYHPYAGVGSVALSCRLTNSRVVETADLYVPVRVIDGAVLTKVSIHFRVASKRVVAPIAMPKLRIMRVPKLTGGLNETVLPEPLKATADGSGFDFLPLVTTGDAWYNDGNPQVFEYVCDQHNSIDVENYDYVAHLVEELGALTPDDPFDGVCFVERKRDVNYVGTNATALSGLQTVDGVAVQDGHRVLIVDSDADLASEVLSAGGSKNGIWIANSGTWARAKDLDEPSDFSPNWIAVAVGGTSGASYGDVNNLTTWQCAYPSRDQPIELTTTSSADDSKTAARIQPAVPKGNIYHALVPTFEVSDLRFQ